MIRNFIYLLFKLIDMYLKTGTRKHMKMAVLMLPTYKVFIDFAINKIKYHNDTIPVASILLIIKIVMNLH